MINALFMFFRSLKEAEVKIELVDKKKQLPSVDTTEANCVLMSQYRSFGVPLLVALQYSAACYPEILDGGHFMMNNMVKVLLVRFVFANFIIWVSWKRGPDWWIKIAPTLMYLITLTNYILIPVGVMTNMIINWPVFKESIYSIYIKCVVIIMITQIFFYFGVIKPYIYFNAMAYIAARKQYHD